MPNDKLPKPHYVTIEELHEELKKQDTHIEEIVRDRVLVVKNDLSKQLHRHITARFNAAAKERTESHEEIKKLIKEQGDALSKKMNPILKNYEAAGTLGKWALAVLTFITIFITALAQLKGAAKAVVDIVIHH